MVFDRIFPDLAGGFVAATRLEKQVTSEQVYQATLSFLYKLLFLLYAEARNLLPTEGNYQDCSLIKLTQEVADKIDKQKKIGTTSTEMYDSLLNYLKLLIRAIWGWAFLVIMVGYFTLFRQLKNNLIIQPIIFYLNSKFLMRYWLLFKSTRTV